MIFLKFITVLILQVATRFLHLVFPELPLSYAPRFNRYHTIYLFFCRSHITSLPAVYTFHAAVHSKLIGFLVLFSTNEFCSFISAHITRNTGSK